MTDVHDKATRSRNMSAIKGKDTKPEVWLRKELFKRGFRYRLHRKDLPGKPDIALPRFKAVIFVNGCFWHCHEGCHYFKIPKSNSRFWIQKLEANKERDEKNVNALKQQGWRVLVVWECAIKGTMKIPPDTLINQVCSWLRHADDPMIEIEGSS